VDGRDLEPLRGCQKISPGCKHCYAEAFVERFRGVPGHPYKNGFDPRLVPEKLFEPLLWPSPKMVFVNSMSDLFQVSVPDGYIMAVVKVMLRTPWHTYQVLTKRSARLKVLLRRQLRVAAEAPHIWWGVSVEDRKHGLPRIDHLRNTPARTRFLSVEPLLENLGKLDLRGIDWVIVGGESGPGARPMEPQWVDTIRQSCRDAHAQFFFKQWGGVQKGKRGRILDGRTYDEMPAPSRTQIPSRQERLDLQRTMAALDDPWPSTPLVQLKLASMTA
jgi:protein gp37